MPVPDGSDGEELGYPPTFGPSLIAASSPSRYPHVGGVLRAFVRTGAVFSCSETWGDFLHGIKCLVCARRVVIILK